MAARGGCNLSPMPAAAALARAREAAAAEVWGEAATWRVVDAAALGWAPASPTGLLVHDTLSARIDPARAVAAAAAAIRRRAEIVAAADDEGAVVWATGWQGLRDLSEAFGRQWARREGAGARPARGDAGGRAAAVRGRAPHRAACGRLRGGRVDLGDVFHDPDSTDAQLDLLHERAVAALPVLHGAPVVRRWAGVRPRARTRAPLLGPWPGRPGHFVANGGFKIGFGIAPKVAQVMADLILDGRDGIPGGVQGREQCLVPRASMQSRFPAP
jgi:glycine oxidase